MGRLAADHSIGIHLEVPKSWHLSSRYHPVRRGVGDRENAQKFGGMANRAKPRHRHSQVTEPRLRRADPTGGCRGDRRRSGPPDPSLLTGLRKSHIDSLTTGSLSTGSLSTGSLTLPVGLPESAAGNASQELGETADRYLPGHTSGMCPTFPDLNQDLNQERSRTVCSSVLVDITAPSAVRAGEDFAQGCVFYPDKGPPAGGLTSHPDALSAFDGSRVKFRRH